MFGFDRMTLSLDPEAIFPRGDGPNRGNPERTIAQLQVEADLLRERGVSPHAPIMAMHRKFSIPVACLVFALIGLALGVTNRKGSKLGSFVLGVGVIFSYYVIMYIGEALAKGQLVSPHLAMWLPNLLLGLVGVTLLLRHAKSLDSERRMAFASARNFFSRNKTTSLSATTTLVAHKEAANSRSSSTSTTPPLSMARPKLLDRYVTFLYLKLVALGAAGMLGIFYISSFIDLSDKLFKGQTTGWVLLQYFWYATPQFVYYVLPISTLVATLVVIGLLTKTSELIVMKACGISLYRITLPIVCFGVVWSICLFGLGETVLARSNQRAEAIRHEIRSGTPKILDILNRQWLMGRDGRIYNYEFFDRQRAELRMASVYELDDAAWRLTQRQFVSQAAFNDKWEAKSGWVRRFGADSLEAYETFQNKVVDFESPDYFASERPDAELMTYSELKTYIQDLSLSGFNVVPYLVELHRKISFPAVTIVMTLIAIPFAVTTGNRGALYGVGLGITLAIGYWITLSIFAAIGSAGLLTPWLAAWAPNIGFTAAAGYLLLSVHT
jgi:LPS export ABC transporter permease LptG